MSQPNLYKKSEYPPAARSLFREKDALLERKKNNAEEQRKLERDQRDIEQRLQEIEAKLADLASTDVLVTEHAIIQYLVRVQGLDLEKIKAAILPEAVKKQVLTIGGGKFPVNTGDIPFNIKVKKKRVVTVLKAKGE